MKFIFGSVGGVIGYFWEEYYELIVVVVIVGAVLLIKSFVKQGKKRNAEIDEITRMAKKQGGFNTIFSMTKVQIENREASDNLDDVVQETVTINTVDGHGSGFVVNTNKGCFVVTNDHVIGDHKYVQITHHDGEKEYGRIERRGDSVDVALISFPNKHGRKGLILENELPNVGDDVFAIGSPLDEEFSNSVSKGIVSNANRVIGGIRYIQSDVTVNPGSSGGPLVVKSNKVVGIAVLGMLDESSGASLGVNCFIPIPQFLKSLKLSI